MTMDHSAKIALCLFLGVLVVAAFWLAERNPPGAS